VGRARVGNKAKLRVVRGGEEMTLNVTIGELPDREDGQADFAAPRDAVQSRIGLQVEPLAPAAAERLGISGGVRVVEARGAAAEAGIQPGDVITRLDNREITDTAAFREIVAALQAGRSVPVLINRGQAPQFLALRVPE
jgi:serine protease Do